MKVTSVILALSAVVAMTQAAGVPGLGDLVDTVSGVGPIVGGIADGVKTSKRGLDGVTGLANKVTSIGENLAKVGAKRELLGGDGPAKTVNDAANGLIGGLSIKAPSKRATINVNEVKAIVDFVAGIVTNVHIQLDAVVKAKVLVKIQELNIAGLVNIDADVYVDVVAHINALFRAHVLLNLESRVKAIIGAHVGADVNINVNAVVADVHAEIVARISALVAGVDATVLAKICAHIKVLNGAVHLPVDVNADIGLNLSVLINNIVDPNKLNLAQLVKNILAVV